MEAAFVVEPAVCGEFCVDHQRTRPYKARMLCRVREEVGRALRRRMFKMIEMMAKTKRVKPMNFHVDRKIASGTAREGGERR